MKAHTQPQKPASQPEYIGMIEHNESVFYITHTEAHIIASTACNAGLIPHYKIPFDSDFTLDENLQALVEHMTEAD